MSQNYEVISDTRSPIKMWTRGVQVEDKALQQLRNLASLPFIHKHVAAMPDVHWGRGCTVGSVFATQGAIIPACVGVDIGCVDKDSEYLSPTGWRKISEYDGGLVMQYEHLSGTGRFIQPSHFIKEPCDEFFWFATKYGINQMLSAEHRVLCWKIIGRDRHREMTVIDAEQLASEHDRLVLGAKVEFETTFTPRLETDGIPLSDAALRVQIMVNADGHLEKPGEHTAILRFRKDRKISRRCHELLKAAEINYTLSHNQDDTIFRFRSPLPTKSFSEFWCASYQQLEIIADECLHWDGNLDERCFYSRDRGAADFIQYVFTATGSRAVMRADDHYRDGKADYRVFASPNTMVGLAGSPKTPVQRVPSEDGFKYCFRVQSGFWVMRRGGNVVMTGNCGMVASLTSLTASDLPDSLSTMRLVIEGHVPHGRTNNGGPGDRGAWGEPPEPVTQGLLVGDNGLPEGLSLWEGLQRITDKHPKIRRAGDRARHHLGTLGTGNHFIEICLDTEDRVWVMLHSGSRGIGNAIGSYFIELAREDMRRYFINLPDEDLAYLPEGTQHHDDYVEAVLWAQRFASKNREIMLGQVLLAMRKVLGREFDSDIVAVNCHHNYVARERHFGQSVWVTRKGAVRARLEDLGIIPGSMGAKSYIVRGLENRESFHSCSHGAGRLMSRGEAKRRITLKEHAAATADIECRKDGGVLDESPAAYKPIDDVLDAQKDLCEVIHELRQVVNVKG